MPRGWPPLTWQKVAACLEALGFVYDRTESSHMSYVHPTRRLTVPVDKNWNPCSGPTICRMVKDQVRVSRKEFYGATKETRRKI